MKHPFSKLVVLSSMLLSVLVFYMILAFSVPFSAFVQITSITYSDMCVGDDTQLVTTERTPVWAIRGEAFGQVFKYEGQKRIETNIKRSTEFGYEPGAHSSYLIEWDAPVEEVGEYGAAEWLTIHPLPLFSPETFFDPDNHRFDVIDCEHENKIGHTAPFTAIKELH